MPKGKGGESGRTGMARSPGALPRIFSGTHTKTIDAKGRVSVPPDFRARFASPELGLYVMRSVTGEEALDVFEAAEFTCFVSNSEQVFSSEAMDSAFAIFGSALNLRLDREGRIVLPEEFREYARIDAEACFIGLGRHFQIWEPVRGRAKQDEAFRNAVRNRDTISLPLARERGATS